MKNIRLIRDEQWDASILAEQIAESLVNNDQDPADFVMLLIDKINLHEVAQRVHKETAWAKYNPDPKFIS
jgi:hypothetical protein